jgi:hypothetical protein
MGIITSMGHTNSYTVTTHKHGIVVEGSLPIDEAVVLTEVWKNLGLTFLDACLSGHFGVTMVVCSPSGSEAWRAEIDATRGPRPADLVERAEWYLRGWDKGASSKTILAALSGRRGVIKQPSVPYDGDDVGRCVRLLEHFPEWRGRLAEVGAIFPEWVTWAARWDEVEAVVRHAGAVVAMCDEINGGSQ